MDKNFRKIAGNHVQFPCLRKKVISPQGCHVFCKIVKYISLREKCTNTEIFLARIFLYSD